MVRRSMAKSAKKRSVALPAKPVPSATSSEEIAQVSEGRSADPGSKQASVVTLTLVSLGRPFRGFGPRTWSR